MDDTTDYRFPSQSELAAHLPQLRLIRKLSETKMSVIYLAEERHLGDRPIAVKIISPMLARKQSFRERFRREMLSVAYLSHPNIVPIFSAPADDELLYLVMPYIDGPNLSSLLRNGPLDLAWTVHLIREVSAALDFAHAAGMVHRDIKPSSILIENRSGRVLLCDIGIVAPALGKRLTELGRRVGTPGYLAPELVPAGEVNASVDPRADVYSLGVVLFLCLTGRAPHQHSDTDALLWAQRHEDAPPVSALRPGLPAGIDRVVRTALAKRPQERYATCQELADELTLAASGGRSRSRLRKVRRLRLRWWPFARRRRTPPPPLVPQHPPPAPAVPPDWQEELRIRDAELADGRLSADDARFLVAAMPDRAPLLADVSLVVRICAEQPDSLALSAPLRLPTAGREVAVLVQAPVALASLGQLEQVVSVPDTGDSDPVRFAFQSREPGLHRVRVSAFAGGTFLAELEVEVSVERHGPSVAGRPVVAPLNGIRARPGEVTLQVRSDGDTTVFQLLSDTCLFEPVLAQASAGDPTVVVGAVERAVDTLRQLAQGRGPYSGRTARRWMQETGIGLWQAAVPELIKEQYWQLRDHITSFTIATSHDIIPWELLYPLRPGSDDGFLVEQFPVLRRVFGQSRARELTIAPCTYVLSANSPENAQREIDAVTKILGGGDIVEDLEKLLDVIADGTHGALHFVCHNSFAAGGSSIALSGGPFVPGLLNSVAARRTLADQSPLVFINACRTAGSIPEYGRMTGWAQQFMAAGAGAFIGTLWPVRSDSARTFAETCYQRLHTGQPLGNAVHEARQAAGRDDSDPTWLAYTAYGDPHATTRA